MLEYIKTILQKVSFDSKLFEKELKKSFDLLFGDDLKALKDWCYQKFGKIYGPILNKYFTRIA